MLRPREMQLFDKGHTGSKMCGQIQPHICLNLNPASFPLWPPGQGASHQQWIFRGTCNQSGRGGEPGKGWSRSRFLSWVKMPVWSLPSLKSTCNTHALIHNKAVCWALISPNPQPGKLAAVPGCRGQGVKCLSNILLSISVKKYQGYS